MMHFNINDDKLDVENQQELDYKIVKKSIDNTFYKFSINEIQNAFIVCNKMVFSHLGILIRRDIELLCKILMNPEFCKIISLKLGFEDLCSTSLQILKSGNEAECMHLKMLFGYIYPFLSEEDLATFFYIIYIESYPKILHLNFKELDHFFSDLAFHKFTPQNIKLILVLSFKYIEEVIGNNEYLLRIISRLMCWNVTGINDLESHPIFCYNMSFLYLNDQNIKDVIKGLKWLKKAAELEESTAINDLAFLYLKGTYIEQDVEYSLQLFKLAAELGDGTACHNLGSLYLNDGPNFGINISICDALKYFEKGSNLKDLECIKSLAYLFQKGKEGFIDQDLYQAEYWYKEGLKLNDSVCIYNLGYLYESELLFTQDIFVVKDLYEKAALLKAPKAMLLLALLYLNGKLGEKDENKFQEWVQKSAELGDKEALALFEAL